ncbi:MAG: carboxypeptidase-like regulatory domain-containing protein, partial [Planctomycetes bacterium]|nr:carboxypeptidase-like regulatory domain-containing protein [Planctomycetota bacterium]
GFYRVYGLTQGNYTLIAGSTLTGRGGQTSRKLRLSEDETLNLDIDLAGEALFGLVKGPGGEPLHAAVVELLSHRYERSHRTLTDDEGCYTILDVPEGEYYIAATSKGCAEQFQGPWSLGKGKNKRKADFTLDPAGVAKIAVSDPDGNPLQGVLVLLSNDPLHGIQWEGSTTYSGIHIFDNLNSDLLTVLIGKEGYAPAGMKINVPSNEKIEKEFTLIPGGSLRMEVKNSEGQPVPHAIVQMEGFAVAGLNPYQLSRLGLLTASDPQFVTDPKGLFRMERLPPGNLRLFIRKNEFTLTVDTAIEPEKENIVQIVIE